MACTGFLRLIAGIRAPGTTGRGCWSIRNSFRSTSCGYPSATTGVRRLSSSAGKPIRHPAGATTGATTGRSIEADGIAGTATPCPPRHRCRPINAIIPGTVTRPGISNRYCSNGITATKRVIRWYASNPRHRRRREASLNRLSEAGRKRRNGEMPSRRQPRPALRLQSDRKRRPPSRRRSRSGLGKIRISRGSHRPLPGLRSALPPAITRRRSRSARQAASQTCVRRLNQTSNAGSRPTRPDRLLVRRNQDSTRGKNGNGITLMSAVRDAGDKLLTRQEIRHSRAGGSDASRVQ